MRVVIVSSLEQRCGVAEYTRDFAHHLESLAQVWVVSYPLLTDPEDMAAKARRINQGDVVHVQYHPDYCGFWRTPLRLRRFLSFLKRIRIPLLITVHDLYPPKGLLGTCMTRAPLRKFLLGKFLNVGGHLVVHAAGVKQFLESLGIKPEKISVLYPGVPDRSTESPYSIRTKMGWRGRKVVTVFGYVTPEKGYEVLLESLAKLPEDVVLVIAGGARDKGHERYVLDLKGHIAAGALRGRALITGYLDKGARDAVLRESDVLVLPYRNAALSGTSYALGVALAAERPIIASDTPYFREIEERYAAIKTFPQGDSAALADALREALERGGVECTEAKLFRDTWGWQNVAEYTHEIYRRMLQRQLA